MERQERGDGRAEIVADVERLCVVVRGVEVWRVTGEAVLALLGDLRAVLTRSETPAPRLGGVLDAQTHEAGPAPPRGRGWRAGWR